jgi:MFS transporter, DHA2 family, multidrug resistance protein
MTSGDSRRWWALASLSLSVLVVALDLFVLTLALPTVSADLHASSSDLQWFVAAYSLVLAAALLPAGLLGDRIGRKRLLTWALAVFGLASLACAYSPSAGELIAARAMLGLAAAVILPMSLAVLPVLFTAEERPRAIAAVGGATFLGYPIGPILGGWLLDHFWWGSVFLINIPVVVVALVAVTALMPESRGDSRRRVDVPGIAISSAGLTSLTYGLIKAGNDGWADLAAVGTMIGGAALLAVFALWERRVSQRAAAAATPGLAVTPAPSPAATEPLVDLTLFGSAGFSWGTILSTLVSFALFGLVFAMPQYFLDVRGLDSLAAGVRMLPMIGGLAVGLVVGQRLQAPRKGRRAAAADPAPPGAAPAGLVSQKVLVAAGFGVMAAALAIGAQTSASSGSGFAAAWFAVTGLGLGIAMPTALNAALGALAPARSGSGSALITAMRQVGGTIGVAVLGTVLATVYRAHLHLPPLPAAAEHLVRAGVAGGVAVAREAGSPLLLALVRSAYVRGLDTMLWVCAGIALTSALLALAFLPGRAGAAAGPPEPAGPADVPAAAAAPGGPAVPTTSPGPQSRMST